jgi:hypothetical protein
VLGLDGIAVMDQHEGDGDREGDADGRDQRHGDEQP